MPSTESQNTSRASAQVFADIVLPGRVESDNRHAARTEIRLPAQGNEANRTRTYPQIAAAQAFNNILDNRPASLVLSALDGANTIRVGGLGGGAEQAGRHELAAFKQAKTNNLFASAATQKWCDDVKGLMVETTALLKQSQSSLSAISLAPDLPPDSALKVVQVVSLLESVDTKTSFSRVELSNVTGVFEEMQAIQAASNFLSEITPIPSRLDECVLDLVNSGNAQAESIQKLADQAESMQRQIDNLGSKLAIKNITG